MGTNICWGFEVPGLGRGLCPPCGLYSMGNLDSIYLRVTNAEVQTSSLRKNHFSRRNGSDIVVAA
jgi:hypothetical protein